MIFPSHLSGISHRVKVGNDVIPRNVEMTGGSGTIFLDFEHSIFPDNGTIKAFQFQCNAKRSFRFQLWRPVDKATSSRRLKLVGEKQVLPSIVSIGFNEVRLLTTPSAFCSHGYRDLEFRLSDIFRLNCE